MDHNFLNLNEGSFPIKIKKELKTLTNLDKLGEIKENIKVDLELDKLSNELFFTDGIISVTFESECQKCFKKMDINLNIEINVGIKDNRHQILDTKGQLEIHYQDLNFFNIDVLIEEEINLSFPSIVNCCEPDNKDDLGKEDLKKVRPFKKIRDLIT